jgi:hypothetical protein
MVALALIFGVGVAQDPPTEETDPTPTTTTPLAEGEGEPLSTAEIGEKLGGVPVFILINDQGAPLVASPEGQTPEIGVWMDLESASSFAEQVLSSENSPATNLTVRPTSLREIFLQLVANADTEERAAFVPDPIEQEKALEIVKELDPEVEQFNAVPLFLLSTDEGDYVTINLENGTAIPLFFSHAQAAQLKTQWDGEERSQNVTIDVSTLGEVLSVMRQGSAEETSSLVFIPKASALQKAQEMMGQGESDGSGTDDGEGQ